MPQTRGVRVLKSEHDHGLVVEGHFVNQERNSLGNFGDIEPDDERTSHEGFADFESAPIAFCAWKQSSDGEYL
jgi:hypothetical protein